MIGVGIVGSLGAVTGKDSLPILLPVLTDQSSVFLTDQSGNFLLGA